MAAHFLVDLDPKVLAIFLSLCGEDWGVATPKAEFPYVAVAMRVCYAACLLCTVKKSPRLSGKT